MVCSEDPPEDWLILEYLARDEEKEIDTAAIHAAFRDVPPDRLDAWLAVMSEDLGLIEEVPGPDPGLSGSGGKAGRRWRICDPRRRFWADILWKTAGEVRGQHGPFVRALRQKAGGPAAVPGGRRPRAAAARMRPGLAVCADRGSRGTGPPALPGNRPGRAARFRVRP